jgi:dienelactone hydrolase
MNRPGPVVARISSIAILLALVACGSSNETNGAEAGDGSETFTPADVGSTSTGDPGTSESPTPQDSSTPTGAGSVATNTEGMVGNITAPVAGTGGDTAGASSSDPSAGDAPPSAGDIPMPSAQPWEQKRAALLEIIGRPQVPLDARETALPDDAGLTVQEFSIATDQSTRISGTSFAPKIEGPLPAVVYLHGTGGSRQDGFGLLRTLAQRGFFALAIDAREHGPGIGQDPYFNAISTAYITGQGHPFLYDPVWDVLRLLDYLEQRPGVDATRIGVVGNSKGGMETYLAAAIDPRIAVAVPWISVESFAWALDNNQWQARVESIQGAFDQAAAYDGVPIDVGFVRRFYDRVVPGITGEFDGPEMVAAIAPRPLLAVNGEVDPRTPMGGLLLCEASAQAAYADVADRFELYIEPNTGHAVTAEATTRTVDWLVQWLQ